MKTTTLYSRADWKFHKNRLGYDDLIDANGRFIATAHVMDLAVSELFTRDYVEDEWPKELYLLDAKDSWSIYLDVPWLTPSIVEAAINKFGKMFETTFVFKPYELPKRLEARYRREGAIYKEIENAVPIQRIIPPVRNQKRAHRQLVTDKRLAQLMTHKLKS